MKIIIHYCNKQKQEQKYDTNKNREEGNSVPN